MLSPGFLVESKQQLTKVLLWPVCELQSQPWICGKSRWHFQRAFPRGAIFHEVCAWQLAILGFLAWFSFTSFVPKSLEWHLSWLGNEPCFCIWKLQLLQARGKCLLLLPAGRSKAEGLDHPRAACFIQGKGGASGLRSLLLFCAGQETQGGADRANWGYSRAVSWESGPRKGKENCNRKEKKQRQKLLFCCTKEGGDPRPLVTQEEAYLEKWEPLLTDPFRLEANYGLPRGAHGNPLQYSRLENGKDRGAWQATYSS